VQSKRFLAVSLALSCGVMFYVSMVEIFIKALSALRCVVCGTVVRGVSIVLVGVSPLADGLTTSPAPALLESLQNAPPRGCHLGRQHIFVLARVGQAFRAPFVAQGSRISMDANNADDLSPSLGRPYSLSWGQH